MTDENSEKAKERAVMSKYQEEYSSKKENLRLLSNYCRQADIAKKTIEKNISLIQSMGALLRSENQKPESSI